MSAVNESGQRRTARGSVFTSPALRGAVFQAVLAAIVVWIFYTVASNTAANMHARNLAPSVDFLESTAGFDVIQALIPYSRSSTYAAAFVVGLLNTVVVAISGIITATIIGFIIGIMRLSRNWVVSRAAALYVEIIRNIPLLLQMFVWYKTVLKSLPGPRQSYEVAGMFFLSNRGLISPRPIWGEGAALSGIVFLAAIAVSLVIGRWARARRERTGQPFPVALVSAGLIIGLPLITFLLSGLPVTFEYPVLQGFNFVGGTMLIPEFMALYLALSIYTAAFIAEIVRAGVLAVSHGQTEAASSLGLTRGQSLRLIIVPQAMRVIIPPLASQYLNLTKNSSLAVAIGYPDMVAVGGTILNQTGQAVTIVMMWMVVYLTLSLSTSALMNWFNRAMRLAER